jgi:hypothetical protein
MFSSPNISVDEETTARSRCSPLPKVTIDAGFSIIVLMKVKIEQRAPLSNDCFWWTAVNEAKKGVCVLGLYSCLLIAL